MDQQKEIKERILPLTIKTIIFFWMFIVIFVFLLLFGPPEFWSIADRIGLRVFFKDIRNWLQPFLEAGYLA